MSRFAFGARPQLSVAEAVFYRVAVQEAEAQYKTALSIEDPPDAENMIDDRKP